MNDKIKIAAVVILLFSAVAVDFVSSTMSMAFDLAFVCGALFILWPMIKDKFTS